MSEDPGSGLPEHFANGLTDELIATLGQIHALSIKSGLSVKALKELPPKEIADRLGVGRVARDHAIDGGPKARVVRMACEFAPTSSRPARRRSCGRSMFERPRGEVLTLQADIAKAIAAAVKATLTPFESITSRVGVTKESDG